MKEVWEEFIATGECNTNSIRPVIFESWLRCKNQGVDPEQTTVHEVLDNSKFIEKHRSNTDIVNISLPIMQKLLDFVKGTNFIVTLTDKEGYILEVLGDKKVADSVQRGNFKKGAKWSEDAAGTNAIGTSIITKKPLQVFAYEHYCKCSHLWTCSAAPITNPNNNQLQGILCMTGDYKRVHLHTLGMVYAAAHAIENELALRNAWSFCEIANDLKEKIIDSIEESIIAINHNGQINQVNKSFCRLFGINESKLLYKDIYNVFAQHNRQMLEVLTENEEVEDHPVIIKNISTRNLINCTATIRFIKADNEYDHGKVVVIYENQKTKKLVSKIFGNQAELTFNNLKGNNPKFLETIDIAKSAAESSSNVLILGESGTGKEIIAQAIHNASIRSDGPFIGLNCCSIPRELIGSELFGYDEGAFTGAKKGGKPGKFELAEGGTLFLDEIGDMPLDFQSFLLRVLEDKKVTRLASEKQFPVDVRIIAATNKDLPSEVKKGTFRNDLFYRLNILTIKIPPLRERKDDIKELCNYFTELLSQQQNKNITGISEDVLELFYNYSWPGNVRQLENTIDRMINLVNSGLLTIDLVPEEIRNGSKLIDREKLSDIEANEKDIIINLLEKNNNNISNVARKLDISRPTLYRKLKKYNVFTKRI